MLLSLLGDGARQKFDFRHRPANFLLDDFAQSDVRCAEISIICDEGTTHTAAACVQLAHTTRDDVDENVGRANFFQSFLAEFSVHNVFQSNFRARQSNGRPPVCNDIFPKCFTQTNPSVGEGRVV